jgi:hypothetical protein
MASILLKEMRYLVYIRYLWTICVIVFDIFHQKFQRLRTLCLAAWINFVQNGDNGLEENVNDLNDDVAVE